MRYSKIDLPVSLETPQVTWRAAECGGMVMEYVSFQQEIDSGPLLTGLPDNRCPCPHWGYVLQGQLRVIFAEHEEVYNAGDVFYMAPGQRPVIGAHTEFVEFSPAEPYRQMGEVIKHNVALLRQFAEA